jgi:uncharacterized protein
MSEYSNIQELITKAEAGDPRAQDDLGDAFRDGNGVPEDIAQAIHWYGQAAEQGNPMSQYSLGVLYDEGRGVPKDIRIAFQWFLAASNGVFSPAQWNVGLCYAKGEGVAKDLIEALKWVIIAAKLGHEQAGECLGVLARQMTSQQVEEAERRAAAWQPS